jgi:hypothetical protein
MNRRRFLEITGLAAAAAAVQACAASVYGIADGPPDGATDGATDGAPRSDARPPSPDARTDGAAVDATAAFVVATAFTVILEDTSCSGHNHSIRVEPRGYGADEIVEYLSGSHLLQFSTRELAQLAAGQRIPFSTIGPGPGHGHCGSAWRRELGPTTPPVTEQCVLRATATCERRR